MRRREFITVVAGVTVAGAVVGRAQQPGMPVIGYLSYTSAEFEAPAFQGPREPASSLDLWVAISHDFSDNRLCKIPNAVVG
jgi:hypothetical protein